MPSTVRGLFVVIEPVQARSEEARRIGVSVRPKGQAAPIVKLHGLANFFDAEDPSVSSYFDGSDLLDVTYVRSSGLVLRMDYWVMTDGEVEIREGTLEEISWCSIGACDHLVYVVDGTAYDVDLDANAAKSPPAYNAFQDEKPIRFSCVMYREPQLRRGRSFVGKIRAVEVLDDNGEVESGLRADLPWEPTDKSEMDEPASFAADCLSIEEALVDEQAALNAPAEAGQPQQAEPKVWARDLINVDGEPLLAQTSQPMPIDVAARLLTEKHKALDALLGQAIVDRAWKICRAADVGTSVGRAEMESLIERLARCGFTEGPDGLTVRSSAAACDTLTPSAEVPPSADAVDHPAHYGGADNPYEAIKVIEAWDLGFHLGNAVECISRAGKKDDTKTVEDLRKARWYLDRHISNLEKAK